MLRRSDKFKFKIANYESDLPKPKRGEVVIIPNDNRLMEFAPFPATHLPEWWAELPKGNNTIRRCQGTYDFISAGFVIPLWTDVTIRPAANGRDVEFRCPSLSDGQEYQIQHFFASATEGCPMKNNRLLPDAVYPKIVSPWRYTTPKGVSLMALPLMHEPNPNYSIIPGIVHTDYYSQVHIVLNVLTDKEFTIPAGTPIQHMIPFKRSEDTKRIVMGNESMHRFVAQTGLGRGGLVQEEGHVYYRKMQKKLEEESITEDMSIIKKMFRINR